ncbi:hypothetical protein GCM10027610_026760 [Dactylosporangium cerinum]
MAAAPGQGNDGERGEQSGTGAAEVQVHAGDRRHDDTGERGVGHGHREERQAPQHDLDAEQPGRRADKDGLDEGTVERHVKRRHRRPSQAGRTVRRTVLSAVR